MRRSAVVTMVVLAAAAPAAAQRPSVDVVLRDAGRGPAATILRAAVAAPHRVMLADSSRVVTTLPSDSIYPTTVFVIGKGAAVAGTVQGDVVVVGGDLFLRPGAKISGRAIAIGGGVYNSTLAEVAGGLLPFRDARYDISRAPNGDYVLDYFDQSPPRDAISFPLAYGFRIPDYDRVDGLSLPWGPRLTLRDERIVVEPLLTYRSNIGQVDPSASLTGRLARRWSAEVDAGRYTLSNDRWNQTDLSNALSVIFSGKDFRNYWRADRVEGRIRRLWRTPTLELTASAGARGERDRSIAAGGSWTLFDGDDVVDGALRPNPAIARGEIRSAVAGLRGRWERDRVKIAFGGNVERPWDTPSRRSFTQGTVDVFVQFPTFGTQTFSLLSHAVATGGSPAPPQRFAYLGGWGTLPTYDVLQFGGDQLLFFEGDYTIPIERLELPIVGPPTVTLREALGAAGVGRLPSLEQNVGVRLALSFLRVDFFLDPRTRATSLGAGLSIMR